MYQHVRELPGGDLCVRLCVWGGVGGLGVSLSLSICVSVQLPVCTRVYLSEGWLLCMSQSVCVCVHVRVRVRLGMLLLP